MTNTPPDTPQLAAACTELLNASTALFALCQELVHYRDSRLEDAGTALEAARRHLDQATDRPSSSEGSKARSEV
jgi:hypothetical protein